MVPLPYTESGAQIVFTLLVGGFVVLELVTRVRSRGNKRGRRGEWRSFAAVISSIYLGFLWRSSPPRSWKRWRSASRAGRSSSLGRFWRRAESPFVNGRSSSSVGRSPSTCRISPDQPVVEAGPYRWLAHPSYTGMILTFAGIRLMLGNWVSLAALLAIPAVGLAFRIRVEERVLLAGIGEPYRRFLASRARLVPGVW